MPFVLESFGSFGKRAEMFIKDVCYQSLDSPFPLTSINLIRALSICLQAGNDFVLLSGSLQAREWRSALRRQRGFGPVVASVQEEEVNAWSDDEDAVQQQPASPQEKDKQLEDTLDLTEEKILDEQRIEEEVSSIATFGGIILTIPIPFI